MVSYKDGAVLAQLGNPDMRTPIAVALGFPERIASGVESIDFTKVGTLTFTSPDFNRYPCLKLAMQASKSGQAATTALNAANEVAVAAFLKEQIAYLDIAKVVDGVLQKIETAELTEIEQVLELDSKARTIAQKIIGEL